MGERIRTAWVWLAGHRPVRPQRPPRRFVLPLCAACCVIGGAGVGTWPAVAGLALAAAIVALGAG